MRPGSISLTRLEFIKVNIEANAQFPDGCGDDVFPQLDFDFNKVFFEIGSSLSYPDDEIDDPRHFSFSMSLSVRQSSQEEVVLPYSITLEAIAYLYFKGTQEGLERFKCVRGTAYPMIYGAFRECVANMTGRGCHGVWFLPSPNFNENVEKDGPSDLKIYESRKKKDLAKKKLHAKTSDAADAPSVKRVVAPESSPVVRKRKSAVK